MGWWKADPVPDPPLTLQLPPPPTSSPQASLIPPHPIPSDSSPSASECPVDPKTRSIWLQHAQQKKNSQSQDQAVQAELPASHPPISFPKRESTPHPPNYASSQECSSDRISQSPPSSTDTPYKTPRPLSHAREISSIPRAQPTSINTTTSPARPANSESETGTSSSGNWIYPSESQFYNAVMRKQTASSPEELVSSISAIIPIHNAVNERAWTLIKAWEEPYNTTANKTSSPSSQPACTGPKLLSFHGLGAGALSPKARFRSFIGYTSPFDRHDWVVERCSGEKVEYVIDFYQGKTPEAGTGTSKQAQRQQQAQLNFYLDVRPKLNSVEGCRMRFEKFVGWR